VRRLRALRDVSWLYPRPVTTVAVQTVAVTTSLLACRALPPSWRPEGLVPLVLGSTGAYAAVRLGSHSGWSKRFKHGVLDWFGGDVDDAQTWMLAALASGGVLVLTQLCRRAADGIGRS
jgi:hypothetical protein